MRFTWGSATWAFPAEMKWKRKYWPTQNVQNKLRGTIRGLTKRCRLSLLTNSVLVYEPKCRGAMSTTVNIAWHPWSPNKLWRFTSIFNLWAQCLQSVKPWDILYKNRCHFFTNWRKVSKWKDGIYKKVRSRPEQLIKTVTDRSGAAKRLVLALPPTRCSALETLVWEIVFARDWLFVNLIGLKMSRKFCGHSCFATVIGGIIYTLIISFYKKDHAKSR